LTSAAIELSNGLKTARLTWEETKLGWKDPVSRDFEAELWEPLEAQVLAVLQAMEQLAPILARARRECS
jgi:hypothetical protein